MSKQDYSSNLIDSYFDGLLDEQQLKQLQVLLNSDADILQQFVQSARFHDRLHNRLASVTQDETYQDETRDSNNGLDFSRPDDQSNGSRRQFGVWVGALACCAALVILAFLSRYSNDSAAQAASVELKRIIGINLQPIVRAFSISAIEVDPPGKSGDSRQLRNARENSPPIDGAILYVRGVNEYVLIRRFSDGSQFISGCDGNLAWSVPSSGRVHVSRDLARFRGSVPGQQHAIPFIDPRAGLEDLQSSYDLVLQTAGHDNPFNRIIATRKSAVRGGPKEVTIEYDAASGLIESMQMNRLPQAKGGPSGVILARMNIDTLPDNFFSHHAHHASEREAIEE